MQRCRGYKKAKIWGTRPQRGSNQRGQANVSGPGGQADGTQADTRDGDFIPNQNFISDYQQLQQLQFLQVLNSNVWSPIIFLLAPDATTCTSGPAK